MHKATGTFAIVLVLVFSLTCLPAFATTPTSSAPGVTLPPSSGWRVPQGGSGVSTKKIASSTETKTTASDSVEYSETGMKQNIHKTNTITTVKYADGSKDVKVVTVSIYKNGDGSLATSTWTKIYNYDTKGKLVDAKAELNKETVETNGTKTTANATYTYAIVDGKSKLDTSTTKYVIQTSEGDKTTKTVNLKYTYDARGDLAGATATETITKKYGETGNVATLTGKLEYKALDGKIRLTKETVSGTIKDKNGKVISNVNTTRTREYTKINGEYHLATIKTTNTAKSTNGATQTINRVYTYQRDTKGNCTGLTVTATGTRSVVSSNGGTTQYSLKNYAAEITSGDEGFKLRSEKYDWQSN